MAVRFAGIFLTQLHAWSDDGFVMPKNTDTSLPSSESHVIRDYVKR